MYSCHFKIQYWHSPISFKCYNFVTYLKGPCHEIFDPQFSSSNNTSYGPDSWAKAVSNMASNSPRKSSKMEIIKIGFRRLIETAEANMKIFELPSAVSIRLRKLT
jgi:hypothetical protein